MSVININNENFQEEVANSDKIVIIDFYADWCGPCKIMGPIFEEVSKLYNNLKFVKVSVDENQEISEKYGVQGIPAFLILKKGEVLDRIVGASSKEDFKEKIDSILNKN